MTIFERNFFYLRYLKPEEGDEYTIKCLTEGYIAGSSGKKNSTQEEKNREPRTGLVAEVEGEAPVPKKTDGNSGESSPFEIKLGVALDLIREVDRRINNDNGQSCNHDKGGADRRNAPVFRLLVTQKRRINLG